MDQNSKIAALLDANYELSEALRKEKSLHSNVNGILGVGVEPNINWSSQVSDKWNVLQFGDVSAIFARGVENSLILSHQGYWDGAAWRHMNSSDKVSIYALNDGQHSFFVNAAGTTDASFVPTVAAKIDDNSTSGNTRFLIYDVDNATLERVSVGAADSGGAGFKVLRIPN